MADDDDVKDTGTPEGGADDADEAQGQSEETDEPAGTSGEEKDPDDMSASEKAQKEEEERDQAKETMEKLEKEGAPDEVEDWPSDKAKYETFGGPEGEHSYHEGPEEEQLGPSSLRHHEDGTVTIAGEEVDDPSDYKGEPIPGGPTDEDSNEPSSGGAGDDSDDDDSSDSEKDEKEEAEAEAS